MFRYRRWAARGTALLVTSYALVDVARGTPTAGYCARALWVVAVVVCGALQNPRRPRLADAAARAVGCVAGACATVLVAAYGGVGTIYFGFLLAVPFCTLLLVPDLPSSAMGAGLVTTLGGVVLLSRDGRPVSTIVEWVLLSGVTNLLASWATVLYGGLWRSELAAERARADALSELHLTEERLDKSERLAALGTLAAGVAHEINNPLAYVKANLCWMRETIQDGVFDRDELRHVLEETERGSERIASIVAELSAYARGREEPQPVDARRIVDEALRIASPRLVAHAEVSVEIAPALPRVAVVPRHLSQALENLLVNAAEAIDSRAAFDASAQRRIALRIAPDGEFVEISVEDSGVGLSAGALEHLFEPFFTTKGPLGTGLGLAISRENLTRFGATIEAGASPLGGARFCIRVPRAAEQPEPGFAKPDATKPDAIVKSAA